MNLLAIYHRALDNYCYCLDKDNIVISIRTGYDVNKVTLYYCDPFEKGIMGGNHCCIGTPIEMTESKKLKNHLFWSVKIKPTYKRLVYYFSFENDIEKYYMYEDRFLTHEEFENFNQRQQLFTFPFMNEVDIFKTPDWVNDTVWYQIFIDRFCNGDPKLNPKDVKPWRKPNKSVGPYDFYGGDIPGITSKIDYLRDLGITGIYLTPIFEASSNHKYNTTDYSKIDSCFGTDEDMTNLVDKAHKNGIKIMLDGVFNHTGEFFMPWQDVLKNGPSSEYFDWFMINKWPFAERGTNSHTGIYHTFAFFDNMPKLNTNNPKVRDYIVNILTSWVEKYDIDGIRMDVAGEISHKLCKEIRFALKNIKPEFYILGELWHDSTPWLRGDEYDSVMNYPFSDCLNDFWINNEITSLDFEHAINRCYTMYPLQANKVLFNLLDSHDTVRLATKLNNISEFYQQLSVLFTMPGTVCIYYGTEIALEGSFDPDCRRCMPWAEISSGRYNDKISIIKQLIALRKSNPALRSNDYKFVNTSDNPRIIIYIRTDDNNNKIMVTLNVSDKDFDLSSIKIDSKSITIKNILFSSQYEENILKSKGIVIYTFE